VLGREVRGDVEVITLARPERRNAMVPELMDALLAYLQHLAPDAGRPIVLTGQGPAFCVGADLKWLGTCADPAEGVARLVARHHAAVLALVAAPVPVVAAINGPTAGGGLSLALAADYRVAAASATFTAAYFLLGLPPDGGNSALLPRAVGLARAMELLLTNRTLNAGEAREWGLVNQVVPDERLLDEACQTAAGLLRVPSATLLDTRRLLGRAGYQGLETQLQREAVAMRSAARRPAFRTALRAFLEPGRKTAE
jgi:2-(1,2-epoxy-1,2-dihydrophenyl)acetyl-CoA isomerase